MLLNLIKYDLKFIFKTVNVYIILLFICAALFNLTSYGYTPTFLDSSGQVFGGEPDAPTIIIILHTIFYNAIIAVLIGLVLNAILRTWGRFKYNLYGDEAYLTHTLPISRHQIWASKFISAVLTILYAILGVSITAFILHFTHDGQNFIGSLGFHSQATTSYTFVYLFAIFIEILFITTCGFFGIILGQRTANHRNLHSILYGFAIYIFSALLLLLAIFIWGNLDPSLQDLFSTPTGNPNDAFTSGFITKLMFGISLIYVVMITTLYFVNQKLLDRGINLD